MNCKQGDIAVIVRSVTHPDEIGLLVSVLELVLTGGEVTAPDGLIHMASEAAWLVEYLGAPRPTTGGLLEMSRYALWADRCLRPIRPGDMEDETPTAEELEAV